MQKEEKYKRKVLQQINRNSDFDTIQGFLMQGHVTPLAHDVPITLTENQERLLEVYQDIFERLTDPVQPMSSIEVRKWLIEEYRGRDHGDIISERNAYRLIRQAKALFFEEALRMPKIIERAMQTELLKRSISELKKDYDQKRIDGDQYYNLQLKYLQQIHKINDLENPDAIDPEEIMKQLALPDTEFTTEESALSEMAEEIDFEDVSDQ